jgi:hypothetical protein
MKDDGWKELKADNVPHDILTGDYEFGYYTEHLCHVVPTGTTVGSVLDDLKNNQFRPGTGYRYRRRQPEHPTHEEIMTKWWNLSGMWTRVVTYEPREPYPYTLLAYANTVNSMFFIGRKSADIPPE